MVTFVTSMNLTFVNLIQPSHAGFLILGTVVMPLQQPTLMHRENEAKREKLHKVNQEIDNTQ